MRSILYLPFLSQSAPFTDYFNDYGGSSRSAFGEENSVSRWNFSLTERRKASLGQYRAVLRDMETCVSLRQAAKLHNLCSMILSRYKRRQMELQMGLHLCQATANITRGVCVCEFCVCSLCVCLRERERRWVRERKRDWWRKKKGNLELCFLLLSLYVRLTIAWYLYCFTRTSIIMDLYISIFFGFNRPCVDCFFKNMLEAVDRHKFHPDCISDVDGSGVTSVPDSGGYRINGMDCLCRKGNFGHNSMLETP